MDFFGWMMEVMYMFGLSALSIAAYSFIDLYPSWNNTDGKLVDMAGFVAGTLAAYFLARIVFFVAFIPLRFLHSKGFLWSTIRGFIAVSLLSFGAFASFNPWTEQELRAAVSMVVGPSLSTAFIAQINPLQNELFFVLRLAGLIFVLQLVLSAVIAPVAYVLRAIHRPTSTTMSSGGEKEKVE